MSVIAFDGHTLAADKRVLSGVHCFLGIKVKKVGELLIGYSGPMSLAEQFFMWADVGFVENECPKDHMDKEKGGIALVIDKSKNIWVYDHSSMKFQVNEKYHAIGAGASEAAVALYLGHSAQEAVQAVSAVNCLCGGGIDSISFD